MVTTTMIMIAIIPGKNPDPRCPSVIKVPIWYTRKATVYPGMEATLTGAEYQDVPVVTDENVTTGHGPGAAFDFSFELVRILNGEDCARELKEQMVFQHETVV